MQTLLPPAPATASTRSTGLPLFFSSFPFSFYFPFPFSFFNLFPFSFFLFFIPSPSSPHLIFLFALYKDEGRDK
jgi:hypothetical protein